MDKVVFFILAFFYTILQSGISQPGTNHHLELLKYIDQDGLYYEYLKPRKQSWIQGELDYPIFMKELDSFYYYIIDNGKRSQWTQKTVIQADTLIKEYADTLSQEFSTTLYSRPTGNKIKAFYRNGRSEYFYDENHLLDSLRMYSSENDFSTQIVVTNGNEEVWRWKKGNGFIRKNIFNEDNHLISSIYCYSDGRYDSLKTYTDLILTWNKDGLVQTEEKRYLEGQMTYFSINEYERDSLGLTKNIFSRNTRNTKGARIPIRYEISSNNKGQTQIARWWSEFKTLYTFDDHDNWIAKEGEYLQQYRVMFYKK